MNTQNSVLSPVTYAFFFEKDKTIRIYGRIQHIENNAIQGTKDFTLATITISNKFDSKRIMAELAHNNYCLFSLVRAIEQKELIIKGCVTINTNSNLYKF